jgi:ribosomal protein S18 acetylase RimI-like enzyme
VNVALRQATLADSGFRFALHKAAMGDYIRAIWGWDEQLQRDYHNRGFIPDSWQIITVNHADAGAINIEYHPSHIYLARIEIQPDHQGHGIGSQLVRNLLDQAATSGRPLVLDVFSINHRAQRLYQRLGFAPDTPQEPDNLKIRMTATPDQIHRS